MSGVAATQASTGFVPAESTLQSLKRETQAVHDALEASPVAVRIMAEDVTQDDVVAFMQANYACLSGLESNVLAQLGASRLCDTLGYSLQTPLLEKDFRRLSLELPETRPVTFACDQAHALGLLYVLMGSQFGKAVIRRHLLRKALNVGALQFFEAPEQLAERWRRFGAHLDTSGLNLDRLREGAADGFTHFIVHWATRRN